ncbi:MAG TPA: response regulator [Anaerolineales bacterium]|jgi:YesN/AraC family two-component response regulator|nr:response regulator [Anaerolineales bacterium]
MAQPELSTRKKLRVLIADDIQETRRNTRLMLATIDDVEVVAIASNGLQAVQFAKEHRPDIVLLDINMPEMDGLTAYREIAKVYPEIGCIIISAEKDAATFRTAISIGVQEYLIKPFTGDELEDAIGKVRVRVEQAQQRIMQDTQVRKQREVYLVQLATEYSKTRRTDDQAMEVFEQLALNPQCEPRWLQTLAMIYVVRQKWDRLKVLAGKLEKRENK